MFIKDECEHISKKAPPPMTDTELRQAKLREVGEACTATIYGGVDVATSDGTKHFSLEQHDQTELMGLSAQLQALVDAGDLEAPRIPYHADGELCRLWSAADFGAIFAAATAHIFYHRTLCNHLNAWIVREQDRAVLEGIGYGSDLPDDLLENFLALVAVGSGA